MVFNRLCDPESKLGILRWMEQALVPDIEEESVTHQHLLRTMDTLSECSDMLEEMMAKQRESMMAELRQNFTAVRNETAELREGFERAPDPWPEGEVLALSRHEPERCLSERPEGRRDRYREGSQHSVHRAAEMMSPRAA